MTITRTNLLFCLGGPDAGQNLRSEPVSDDQLQRFVHHEFQQLLTMLCLLLMAGLKDSGKTPPGITKRFHLAFSRPVLGTLLAYAVWLSQQSESPAVGKIADYLQGNENGKPGWLGKSISLRNKIIHESQEDLLDLLREHIKEVPVFESFGNFEAYETGGVRWVYGGESLALAPFISVHGGVINYLHELDEQSKPLNQSGQAHQYDAFAQWFSGTRIKDSQLEDPSTNELVLKIQNMKAQSYINDTEDLGAYQAPFKSLAVFTGPDSMSKLVAAMRRQSPDNLAISSGIKDGEQPLVSVSRAIGIGSDLSFEDIIKLGNLHPLLIGIDTGALNSRAFLKLLFWIYDLGSFDAPGNLTIVIGRDREQLEKESDGIWDELPADFHELMNSSKASRNKPGALGYFWEPANGKGLLGKLKGLFN